MDWEEDGYFEGFSGDNDGDKVSVWRGSDGDNSAWDNFKGGHSNAATATIHPKNFDATLTPWTRETSNVIPISNVKAETSVHIGVDDDFFLQITSLPTSEFTSKLPPLVALL